MGEGCTRNNIYIYIYIYIYVTSLSLAHTVYILASLLASRALLAQLYADDVQAYQHCRASDATATARAMSIAMDALGTWMSSNRLRLNSLKTKFIWLGTRQQLAK